MPDNLPLTDWPKGAVFPLGSHLQESVDALRALAQADGFNLQKGQISLNRTPLAKLTAVSSAGTGKYDADIYTGVAGENVTAALELPEGMTAGESCLVVNIEEDSALGFAANVHTLKIPSYVIPFAWGWTSEDTPRPLLWVRGGVGETASPKILANGSTTAATDTWDKGTDGLPVNVTFVSAVVWDGSSNTWKQNTRTMKLDARGLAYNISAETQTTITATTPC